MPLALFLLSLTGIKFFFINSFAVTPFWLYVPCLIFLRCRKILLPPRPSFYTLFFSLALLLLSSFSSLNFVSLNSLLLTIVYLLIFLSFIQMAPYTSPSYILKALLLVLLCYFVPVLLIKVLSFFGLAEFAPSLDSLSIYDPNYNIYRFQGLSTEPSYSATIASFSILAIHRLLPKIQRQKPWFYSALALAPFLTVISFYSVIGLLLTVIVYLSTSINLRRQAIITLLISQALVIFVIVFNSSAFESFISRVANIFTAFYSSGVDALLFVDGSSYLRLDPVIYFFQQSTLLDTSFWLGHGPGIAQYFFGSEYGYLAGADVSSLNLGFVPAFIYDYGILCTLAFLKFFYECCAGAYRIPSFLCILVTLFNCNVNTQLLWFALLVIFITSTSAAPVYRVNHSCR